MKSLTKITILVILFLCSNLFAQESQKDVKYKRSSLYTLMLSDDIKENSDVIESTFKGSLIPDKFNNHIIDLRIIPKVDTTQITISDTSSKKKKGLLSKIPKFGKKDKGKDKKIQLAIYSFLDSMDIAKSMVAKWFNRSESGGFNTDLISQRGFYNATDLDIKISRNTERGSAMLSDAGEKLINNTFVIVNDFRYTNKEEIASKTKGVLNTISLVTNNSDIATVSDVTSAGLDVAGKGYIVKTKAYLYKLVWNEEVAAIFYNDFWTEDGSLDSEKVKAFNETDIFKLKLLGEETAWADVQSTTLTQKTNDDLIALATIRAVDNVIAKLQRKYEVFRTKSPLLSGDPIAAKIGLKEGIEKGDKYEVLEQVIDKDGHTEYKRVGVIKVDKNHIWDNRFMADEESNSTIEYTTFSGSKNKYYSGMLIRQIN
ncbi:hypothetical protein [Winogradskyella sp. PG-2]|uniref:hypothetical protein n=1 Tax=Winogradskyella sp. PG-2 TaxID=754409 RepID=UPI0004586B05|nr:hypothetical protein [Winogradskyella sp. PG-2]BAO76875.1 hypothetical protein WPG_2645 [Winogradskyella sp. PG-2]